MLGLLGGLAGRGGLGLFLVVALRGHFGVCKHTTFIQNFRGDT